ncbi:MAG: LptA/OstA family protein [Prosthecobacter sp.]|nr:LptA/OstA family protein [Prosthecobacter sp.]
MRRIFCIIPIALLATSMAAQGQGAGPSRLSPPSSDRKKDLKDAAEKLRQAKDTMDLEKAKKAAEGLLEKLPPKMTETAKDALESPENRGKILEAAKSAAGSLLPEAQKLMRGDQAPATAPPANSAVAGQPPAALGPAPIPLPSLVGTAPALGKNAVTIESDDSTFDLKNAIFIYTGHVRARHPQFYIECEELEVHMNKDDELPEKKTVPKNDPLHVPGTEKKSPDNRVKMAIATGPMVTIEKRSESGEIQQGKCKRAVYNGSTGEIVMSDYPQVQSGNMLHIATDPSTEMIFDPNGKFHSNRGRQRTIILQADTVPGASPAESLPKSKPNAP